MLGTPVGVYRYQWIGNREGIKGDEGGFVFVWEMYGAGLSLITRESGRRSLQLLQIYVG